MSSFLSFFAKFQGFISIDCGGDEDYIDKDTGIPYKSDKELIDNGIVHAIHYDSSVNLKTVSKEIEKFSSRKKELLHPETGTRQKQ